MIQKDCKRRRVNSSVPAAATGDQPNAPVDGTIVASESLWHEACRMANRLAPRVGNHKYEADSDLGELVQQLVDENFKVRCVFICRGTDRFQVPCVCSTVTRIPMVSNTLYPPKRWHIT